MLTVHHLERSQSERIIWLCEELGIEYKLKTYPRDKKTFQCPPELQALSPTKSAPVIQDGKVTLGESGAVVEYILTKYGNGKLTVPVNDDNYADYLYFLHFGNGYLQPALQRYRALEAANGLSNTDPGSIFTKRGFTLSLSVLNDRLTANDYLAGGTSFTAADIMCVFSLTTMRLFIPFSLEEYPKIVEYLERVSRREGYRRAMGKGDPGFEPVICVERPKSLGERLKEGAKL